MIYMDNAATTKVCQSAKEAMLPFLTMNYGNPSGKYRLARSSRREIEKSREIIASTIGANPQEIYFTSGGTESDNWAITSAVNKMRNAGVKTPHIITSVIEHKAVLNTCKNLESQGVSVTYLPVDSKGYVSINALEKSICNETAIITVMYANNEIGTIQNCRMIGEIADVYGVAFHTDAVQAYGHIPIDVKKEKIGMLSASGHKFGAPKGIGFLYVDKKIKMEPLIFGGGQETGLRSGTENVPGIVAMGAAAKYHHSCMDRITWKENFLRNYIIEGVTGNISGVMVNGDINNRLPGNISFSIEGINGASMVEQLDKYGICISAGSACSSKNSKASHVLLALGKDENSAFETIRVTISSENTKAEADEFIHRLTQFVYYQRNQHICNSKNCI